MGANASSPTDTGSVQNQANQLMDAQTKLTEIQFQVQSSTNTFTTSSNMIAASGSSMTQAAEHIGSATRP